MKIFTNITLEELDAICKTDKGWVRNITGHEYVYDRIIPNTKIMIKILSSIKDNEVVDPYKADPSAIRIFAVKLNNSGKVVGGLVKARTIFTVDDWVQDLKMAYFDISKIAQTVNRKVSKIHEA